MSYRALALVINRSTAALALFLALISCSRQPANSGPERLAILRFENLGADKADDWMGRALSQIVTRDLARVSTVYAIPFETLYSRDAAFGVRPVQAPGISAERTLALAAAANRIGYGEYSVRSGKLEAMLTIEDPQTQKAVRVVAASEPASKLLEAADSLARAISREAAPYPTRNPAALEAYAKGLESADAAARSQLLEQAIAADPDFGPPYLLLAQLKAQLQDQAGALGILNRGLSRKMPELESARLAFLRGSLRGDFPAAREALLRSSRSSPNDPELWMSLANDSMARHQYQQAMQAYQKALAIEPENSNTLNQLGYSAAYSGQLDTAMTVLKRYQALRPGDANPLDSLGDVNLVLGRLREAESFYLKAAKRDPAFLNGGDYFKAAMARLMSGDVGGADGLAKQFADARTAAKDPMVDFHRAEWSWISGRRKEGYRAMQEFAEAAEKSGGRTAASEAYSQLAIWSVALGDRGRASQLAQKAATLSGSASSGLAAVALLLSQPSARAVLAAVPAQQRDLVLAYALVADKQFAEAARLLEPIYEHTSVTGEEALPVLLAWSYLETGKPKEAAGLLRFNPIPSPGGVRPLSVFEFPRLFYLRGRVAAKAGNPEQAQSYYQLFEKLSGDEPLMWDADPQ